VTIGNFEIIMDLLERHTGFMKVYFKCICINMNGCFYVGIYCAYLNYLLSVTPL
jgi:hypothetical protein